MATEPALAVYAYNPSTQEAQTRASQVLGQPELRSETPSQASPTLSTSPTENLVLLLL